MAEIDHSRPGWSLAEKMAYFQAAANTGTLRVFCGPFFPAPQPFASLHAVAADRKPLGLAIPSDVLGWAFTPDCKTLATTHAFRPGIGFLGAPSTTVFLWEAATGQLQAALAGHTRAVRCAAFSPDGRLLASGCDDGTVLVWDLLRPKQ